MSTLDCKWKTPAGPTRGIVVWSVDWQHAHCPRCCGMVNWNRERGMCATGHVLVLDPREVTK